jgi:hypothetical protein
MGDLFQFTFAGSNLIMIKLKKVRVKKLKITLQAQPTKNSCGQTAIAMLLGVPVKEIVELLGHDKKTYAKDQCMILNHYGVKYKDRKKVDNRKKYELPSLCLIRINKHGRRVGHLLLYYNGIFYDSMHGGRTFKRTELVDYYPKWRIDFYFEIISLPKEKVDDAVAGI